MARRESSSGSSISLPRYRHEEQQEAEQDEHGREMVDEFRLHAGKHRLLQNDRQPPAGEQAVGDGDDGQPSLVLASPRQESERSQSHTNDQYSHTNDQLYLVRAYRHELPNAIRRPEQKRSRTVV